MVSRILVIREKTAVWKNDLCFTKRIAFKICGSMHIILEFLIPIKKLVCNLLRDFVTRKETQGPWGWLATKKKRIFRREKERFGGTFGICSAEPSNLSLLSPAWIKWRLKWGPDVAPFGLRSWFGTKVAPNAGLERSRDP